MQIQQILTYVVTVVLLCSASWVQAGGKYRLVPGVS